ncbi:MAG TPA: helix-turn-helix transcriptional regulator [Pseudonocardiaceae bacterium]|nr:helix-turn-helix transcriptional regulator [Pseudonocardiaceae bacterium]
MTHPAEVRRNLPQPGREDLDLVSVLHALADPVRLKLVANLVTEGDTLGGCSPEHHSVPLSASTLSHHWRVLREAGLTTTVADGRRRIVTVRVDDLEARFPGLLTAVLGPVLGPVFLAAQQESPGTMP